MEQIDLKSLLQKYVRASEQRGMENLNADFPFMVAQSDAYPLVCDALISLISDLEFDFVAAIEAMGFPMGGALAHARRVGFIPIRKEGLLPGDVVQSEVFINPYKKRETKLEIQKDIMLNGRRVLLFDEATHTGISLSYAVRLLKKQQATIVSILTVTNYPDLKEIEGVSVRSLVYGQY
jgi:adenine phosphoribosyltransferase